METNFVSIFRHDIIYYRVWTIYGPLTQWNVTSKKKTNTMECECRQSGILAGGYEH